MSILSGATSFAVGRGFEEAAGLYLVSFPPFLGSKVGVSEHYPRFIESQRGNDLGNLNPIHELKPMYEKVLNKPDIHQSKGMLNVCMCGDREWDRRGGEGGRQEPRDRDRRGGGIRQEWEESNTCVPMGACKHA